MRLGLARCSELVLLVLLLGLTPPHALVGPRTVALSTGNGASSLVWPDTYAVLQHPLPNPGSEPWVVTTDLKGRVWFAEQSANVLGEYDPTTGRIQQYQIPTERSTPDAVAVDVHGNVWFSELTTNRLGELPSAGGRIVEYPIPGATVSLSGSSQTLSCGPGAIAPDPSGSLWVACLFSNQIDEFFPARTTFDIFNLPVFQSAPAGLLLDGKGDLWFTAADAQMLGKAAISEMVNNTSQGITEFAPVNQTYSYKFNHPTSFLGSSEVITSSLPTPSGIAMDASGELWVTEHVDSSFDSYNPSTQSLVRYWTSQTHGIEGYPVSFPNGVAVDGNGTVWVGEHYGNKLAEFVPSTGRMTEYPVPCCRSSIAGVYSVALDPQGRLWFVEINGNAIGELVREPSPLHLELSLPQGDFVTGPRGTVTVPLLFSEPSSARNSTTLTFAVSGISATGKLPNSTAMFSPPEAAVTPGSREAANLTIGLNGLDSGVYYLTLGASSTGGVIYSAILKLTVTGNASGQTTLLVAGALGAAVASGFGGWILARRRQARGGARRPLSRRYSLRSCRRTTAATPPRAA